MPPCVIRPSFHLRHPLRLPNRRNERAFVGTFCLKIRPMPIDMKRPGISSETPPTRPRPARPFLPVVDPEYDWDLQLNAMPFGLQPGEYGAVLLDNVQRARAMPAHKTPQRPRLQLASVQQHMRTYGSASNWPVDGPDTVMAKLLNALEKIPDLNIGHNLREWTFHGDQLFVRYGHLLTDRLAWEDSQADGRFPHKQNDYTALANYARWLIHKVDVLPLLPSLWQQVHRYVGYIATMDDLKFQHYRRQPHAAGVVHINTKTGKPLAPAHYVLRTYQRRQDHRDLSDHALKTIALGYAWEAAETKKAPVPFERLELLLDKDKYLQSNLRTELCSSPRWLKQHIEYMVNKARTLSMDELMRTPDMWGRLHRMGMSQAVAEQAKHQPEWALQVYRVALSDELYKGFPPQGSYRLDGYRQTQFWFFHPLVEAMTQDQRRAVFNEWLDCMGTYSKGNGYSNWEYWADQLIQQRWLQTQHDDEPDHMDVLRPWLLAFEPECTRDLNILMQLGSTPHTIGTWLLEWRAQCRHGHANPMANAPVVFEGVEDLW